MSRGGGNNRPTGSGRGIDDLGRALPIGAGPLACSFPCPSMKIHPAPQGRGDMWVNGVRCAGPVVFAGPGLIYAPSVQAGQLVVM